MMDEYTFERLRFITNKTMGFWRNAENFAPENVVQKFDSRDLNESFPLGSRSKNTAWSSLELIISLTDALDIWLSKSTSLTIGELILARVNMGSLVESWLRFFYCVYLEDYQNKPIKDKDPDNKGVSFEDLKRYSRGILWEKGDEMDEWIGKIQNYRNAIHLFPVRKIGCSFEFEEDFKTYCKFVEMISDRVPDPIDIYYIDY